MLTGAATSNTDNSRHAHPEFEGNSLIHGSTPHEPFGHYVEAGAAIARASECFAFLRSVPILLEIDDNTLWDIARSADVEEFPPHGRVVAQGEAAAQRFFIIRSGSADVLRSDRTGAERIVARLSIGSYFGELGLLTDQARNATVKVHGSMPLRAYAFDALTFHRRIAEHVLVFRVLRDRRRIATSVPVSPAHSPSPNIAASGRRTNIGRLRVKELDLLRRLPKPDLEFVLDHAEQRWHPQGSEIIREGDDGDRFYILLDGSVDVVRNGEHLARLKPGDFFGETALLLDTPRTASVCTNDSAAQTWSITRAAFQRLVGGYLLSNPQTQEEIVRRMQDSPNAGNSPLGSVQ